MNAPNLTVVSGHHDAIAALAATLNGKDIASRLLPTSHAFHSPMMEAVIPGFIDLVRNTPRQAPTQPWVSSLTGTFITDAEATDPSYWARQLREPVRFMDGLGNLLNGELALLEVGPGQALAGLARQHAKRGAGQLIVTSLHLAQAGSGDFESLLAAAGQLWTRGVALDWRRLHNGAQRRRVAAPTYPFARNRRWVDPAPSRAAAARATAAPAAAGPNASTVAGPAAPSAAKPSPSARIHMTQDRSAKLIVRLQALFARLSGMSPQPWLRRPASSNWGWTRCS